jgi:hypothetical protein
MVVPDGLPLDVVQFVNDTVDSIEQLELLVMLIESSDRWWDAVSAGRALGVSPGMAQRDLESVTAAQHLSEAPAATPRMTSTPSSGPLP